MATEERDLSITARDGFELRGTLRRPEGGSRRLAIINSATAVPRRFYRHFAKALAESGYTTLTYDYRGIGESRPESLRGFEATVRDWALLDMAGVIDWSREELDPARTFLIGHSVGGQVAGLLDNADAVDGMITLSSQSGYWALQGKGEKAKVFFHVHVTLPLLASTLGYMPWSKVGSAEDLPKGAALEWSRWCRSPNYLFDDDSLPLERFRSFEAPVLAYSFADDTWGTRRSVDNLMRHYPHVERRHVDPRADEVGVSKIGHFGYFRPDASSLWPEAVAWMDARSEDRR